MSLSEIMSTRVVSVHLDDSIQSLRELFDATGEGNALAGVSPFISGAK